MLISNTADVDGLEREQGDHDHTAEYQTASELFELMSRNNNLEPTETESLTAQDLVLLYKNIDIGTRLMSDAIETKFRKPNQYVETIVYNDDSDGSDVSEIYSNDDLRDVFLVNNERIDLINSQPTFDNTLCHKFGNFQIRSGLSSEYDKFFLFKDAFIKGQVKNLSPPCNALENASLLDYICCRRLDDNNSFYMDNIITNVKRTIDQLKRISNGDYLTDKAKAKWREGPNNEANKFPNDSLALATSTSIPLQIERNQVWHKNTWDDIVHSEVDVRSLTKILEKKIILDVPRLIAGSYILSKQATESLVISYKKDVDAHKEFKEVLKKNGARVDLLVQLERSETERGISNISSIVILQSNSPMITETPEILALPFKDDECTKEDIEEAKVVEIIDEEKEPHVNYERDEVESHSEESSGLCNNYNGDTCIANLFNEEMNLVDSEDESQESSRNEIVQNDEDFTNMETKTEFVSQTEFKLLTSDDLQLTMQRLNVRTPLPEESGEDIVPQKLKKSPTRYRIKSPYENKSHAIEENKRKKLLEIRERREKRKIALSEKCKAFREKYGKNTASPQSSGSVTNLSITNKSFYNSIYGQKHEAKQSRKRQLANKKDTMPIMIQADHFGDDIGDDESIDHSNKKYVNRDFDLDNPDTEVMHADIKGGMSTSTSTVSNDLGSKLNFLAQLIDHSSITMNETIVPQREETDEPEKKYLLSKSKPQSVTNLVPANTPKNKIADKSALKRHVSFECRKSISKIYDLINVNSEEGDSTLNNVETHSVGAGRTQPSDSGTSLKHILTSVTSSSSFNKQTESGKNTVPAVIPKVIISNKLQTAKAEIERFRRVQRNNNKKFVNPPTKDTQQNPLKAISQLLHEFDNVQKTRLTAKESKIKKKFDSPRHTSDLKTPASIGTAKIRSRFDQNQKDMQSRNENPKDLHANKTTKPRCVRGTPITATQAHQNLVTEKEQENKQKMADIIDEVREARGEAVRGPSKPFSRLYSLAQPKKCYVQAHSEEYQNKYGRNLMADRLKRLAQQKSERLSNTKLRQKRIASEIKSGASIKQPPPPLPSSVRASRIKRSSSSSPEINRKSLSPKTDVMTSENINKKMVAVASYVNYHYGRAIRTNTNKMLRDSIDSRIPYFSDDFELGSINSSRTPEEESSSLGSKIHLIIDSMFPNHKTSTKLIAVKECTENSSVSSKHNCKELVAKVSVTSNEPNYIAHRKSIVEIVANKATEAAMHQNSKDEIDKSLTSRCELQKLENALSHLPFVNAQKRLGMRNLTLTPNPSLQQVFLLQSGDASSLFAKPSRSHMKIKASKSQTNVESKMATTLPDLYIDFNYNNIPMQIATVGYAFPEIKDQLCASMIDVNKVGHIDNIPSDNLVNIIENKIENSHNLNGNSTPITEISLNDDNVNTENASEYVEEVIMDLIKSGISASENDTPSITINNSDETVIATTAKNNNANDTDTNDIDYTTSLDMLVGILNEIKSITTCQTRISNSEYCKNDDIKELEFLNRMVLTDKERVSGNKCYIHDIENLEPPRNMSGEEICKNLLTLVDKEVSAEFPLVECVNKVVEAQSQFFPMTINHSTNMTNSLIGILSKPSSQSLLLDFTSTYSRSSLSPKTKITELSNGDAKMDLHKSVIVYESKPKPNSDEGAKRGCKTRVSVPKLVLNTNDSLKSDGDFDVIKMKRDILVTVYSILVITVFAALSFPNFL